MRAVLNSVLTVGLLIATISLANAGSFTRAGTINIRNDGGGHVIHYAIKARQAARDGQAVRFSGRCDSACTLFLSLPTSNTCVSPGASFGFHKPYGATMRGNHVAHSFLMSSYPDWVRSWIRSKGGLTARIKRMDYVYASRFLPTCESPRSQNVSFSMKISENLSVHQNDSR